MGGERSPISEVTVTAAFLLSASLGGAALAEDVVVRNVLPDVAPAQPVGYIKEDRPTKDNEVVIGTDLIGLGPNRAQRRGTLTRFDRTHTHRSI